MRRHSERPTNIEEKRELAMELLVFSEKLGDEVRALRAKLKDGSLTDIDISGAGNEVARKSFLELCRLFDISLAAREHALDNY